MAGYRKGRINEATAQELAIALQDIRDPRIQGNFVSITRAEVAADLKTARIYFSAMGDVKEAGDALQKAAGVFRRHLAATLNLRLTPELRFVSDNSISHGAHISELLSEIEKKDGPLSDPKQKDEDR